MAEGDMPEEWVERLARIAHQQYLATQVAAGHTRETLQALVAWEDLAEDYRQQNLDQVRTFPEKLSRFGWRIVEDGHPLVLTDAQVEELAEIEHDRWVKLKRRQGYERGETRRDEEPRTHPDLLPWALLREEAKAKNRQAARTMADLLARAGLGVLPLTHERKPTGAAEDDSGCVLDDRTIAELAQRVHDHYLVHLVPARALDGTVMASELAWDALSDEARQQNVDYVRSLPEAFAAVGMVLRPIAAGSDARLRVTSLTADEVESLASFEHDRWRKMKEAQGYRLGPRREDGPDKTHPEMVPFRDLPEDVKGFPRAQVRQSLAHLTAVGWEVVRGSG